MSKKNVLKKGKNTVKEDENTTNTPPERLIPLTEWPRYHPWPPVGGLRHIRFFAEEKGATDCFVKSGGRVLIREQKFFMWASVDDAA